MVNKLLKRDTRPHVLSRMAKERGTTVEMLIKGALNERGSVLGAAKLLGVSANTIYHHLRKRNLTVKRTQLITLEKEHVLEQPDAQFITRT